MDAKNIVIACFPKSGSTYLSKLLSIYTGYTRRDYVHAWGRREQEWEKNLVEKIAKTNAIIQQHTKASDATLNLIKEYNLLTIVLVRNIFDIIPSLRDHFKRESVEWPIIYLNDDYSSFDEEKQLNAIIDLAIPWYISFYVSWFYAIKQFGFKLVTYEQLFNLEESEQQFKDILEYVNVEFVPETYLLSQNKIEKEMTRFNKGIKGRGRQLLSEQQFFRIRQYCSYYPDVDFSPIGISL